MTSEKFKWDADAVATLIRLWVAENRSASQIAALIGTTRNSVIGKANRLGLSGTKDAPAHPRNAPRPRKEQAAKPAPIKAVTLAKPTPLPIARPVVIAEPVALSAEHYGITFAELGPRSCRYALGGRKDRPERFCGHETSAPGSSWCAWHRGIVYQPRPSKSVTKREFRIHAWKAAAR